MSHLPAWSQELLPILGLLLVIVLLVRRLPKVDIGHTPAFLARRRINWLFVGLTYAFLYMGRYNLTVAKNALGGLISTFAAFEKPASWGWVGAQSSSYFWNGNAMITRVQQSPKIPVRFYLDSGCPDDNCDVTDQMDTVMTQKGYDHVRIKELNAEHDWSFWRGRLGGLLTHFRENQTVCD